MDRGVKCRQIKLDTFEDFLTGYQQFLSGDITSQGFLDGTWQLVTEAINEAYEKGLREGSYGSLPEEVIDNTDQLC